MSDISIIVPAYNAEKYIKKCLESLINQTKKEIEIIVINDGSTDKTEKIIKSFKDERIRYCKIHTTFRITKQIPGISEQKRI